MLGATLGAKVGGHGINLEAGQHAGGQNWGPRNQLGGWATCWGQRWGPRWGPRNQLGGWDYTLAFLLSTSKKPIKQASFGEKSTSCNNKGMKRIRWREGRQIVQVNGLVPHGCSHESSPVDISQKRTFRFDAPVFFSYMVFELRASVETYVAFFLF